jgi:hypothetical protein
MPRFDVLPCARDGHGEWCDGVGRSAPAQEADSQDAMGEGVLGCERRGFGVNAFSTLVVAAELAGKADQYRDSGRPRHQCACALECVECSFGVAERQVRAPQGDPYMGVPGVCIGAALQMLDCAGVVVGIEGAKPDSGLAPRAGEEGPAQADSQEGFLTDGGNARTIPCMQREALQKILQTATGLIEKGTTFEVPAEHRVTVYIGREGRGVAVSEVEELKLCDGFLRILAREPGEVYTDYAEVSAIAVKPPKPDTKSRAGFA